MTAAPEDIDLHAEIALLLESVPADQQADTMRELVEIIGGMWLAPEEAPAIPHYQELMVGGIHATGATMAECVADYLAQAAGRARDGATTHDTTIPTLCEARATIADAAHHAPHDLLTACVVVEDQTDEPAEAEQAR
ncbi:MAG TPA: hypothetical protein DEB47_17550, partial [Citreicella sp.]|nr:hypothetical protein [Citreicella sp.]